VKKKSIAVIKELFAAGGINDETLKELKDDERKGVKHLLKIYEAKLEKAQKMANEFEEMCHYENDNYLKGRKYIAGVDEAGRGPLAGPVVAAAVILPKDFKLIGLTDSKQLSKQKRDEFYEVIINQAVSYSVSVINNQLIDEINIFEATKRAMLHSIQQLSTVPDHVLIDAVELDNLHVSSQSIVKGDQKSITIAAASVIAKVMRDRLMFDIHAKYPMYDFASNMGYGTKHHLDMLHIHGITPYHRKTFAPVRSVIN
jgi:ribonuclease HII